MTAASPCCRPSGRGRPGGAARRNTPASCRVDAAPTGPTPVAAAAAAADGGTTEPPPVPVVATTALEAAAGDTVPLYLCRTERVALDRTLPATVTQNTTLSGIPPGAGPPPLGPTPPPPPASPPAAKFLMVCCAHFAAAEYRGPVLRARLLMMFFGDLSNGGGGGGGSPGPVGALDAGLDQLLHCIAVQPLDRRAAQHGYPKRRQILPSFTQTRANLQLPTPAWTCEEVFGNGMSDDEHQPTENPLFF